MEKMDDGSVINLRVGIESGGNRLEGGKRDVRFGRDIPYSDKQVERAESDQQVCHHLLPQVHGGLRHPS
ncbi:unnamed protein product [Clavelina lepadiformis]|uniref:Uncharacterized protein n=1 Tax=Clavelina lepadiformis TaxID=159417 RepID=A0ABP0FSG6_CLALP